MGNPLRDRRTPSEWAATGQNIEIAEKIGSFRHLAGIVGGDLQALDPDKLPSRWRDAAVTGRLSFGFADAQQRVPRLEGRVVATVDAVCQRCLGPLRLPLEVELRFLFEGSESDAAGEGGYEVWELDEERLRPLDLIEEVLVMALPLAALHDDDEACVDAERRDDEEESTQRPFAMLKAQMEEKD